MWEFADAIRCAHGLFPQKKSKPKATNSKQVQSLLDGIETKHESELEDAAPKEADEDAAYAGCQF